MNQKTTDSLPTWRHWGEEKDGDAIFTVYLKKVRYHRSTPLVNHDTDDNISHLEWETVRVRFVKAATLKRLVEALATVDEELESTFINVFLATYRTFASNKEVLHLLIKRFDELQAKHICNLKVREKDPYDKPKTTSHNLIKTTRRRSDNSEQDTTSYTDCEQSGSFLFDNSEKTLVSTLHIWLDGFPEDWNEETLHELLAFASKRLPRSELHLKVLHRLERKLRLQICNDQGYLPSWSPDGSNETTEQQKIGSAPINHELAFRFSDLCLVPAFRGGAHFLQAFRFPHIPVRHFAEQLTRMDSNLFKQLIPHQCLGAIWACRDKARSETVVATINQFNAVLFRVISSILVEPNLKPQERSLNIATWIDIAQELRLLKNFSSLKAIISGLQSNPIYRLSKTWAFVPKEKLEVFNELARIFCEDNNAWTQREVLMREGTSKFADTVGEHDRRLQKIIQKQSTQTSYGTIPYLGTFLTDLTMIHTAIPDTIETENGLSLINFDKKRKEFEVLAQIKLLQGAANTYNLCEDPYFDRWFASILLLDEREAHTLSCQLEPPTGTIRSSQIIKTPLHSHSLSNSSVFTVCDRSARNCNSDSIKSNSSCGSGSQCYFETNNRNVKHDVLSSTFHTTPPSESSSVSNIPMESSNAEGRNYKTMNDSHSKTSCGNDANDENVNEKHESLINGQLMPAAYSKSKLHPSDFYIIRVTYETNNMELEGIVLYKSIMVGNNERTPQVIRNAMMKLGLEQDPMNYTLSQVLPDKDLVMPRDANVYYAVDTNYNLNFILRPRKKAKS